MNPQEPVIDVDKKKRKFSTSSMSELKDVEVIDVDSFFNSPPEPVFCLKNRDEIKKFEEQEDCFILEFDPEDDQSKPNDCDNSDAELCVVVAEKGQVACRDYPHSRSMCAKFPFEKTPHETYCEMCYCYVCDLAAPCEKWCGASGHCHAFNNFVWNSERYSRKPNLRLENTEDLLPSQQLQQRLLAICAAFDQTATLPTLQPPQIPATPTIQPPHIPAIPTVQSPHIPTTPTIQPPQIPTITTAQPPQFPAIPTAQPSWFPTIQTVQPLEFPTIPTIQSPWFPTITTVQSPWFPTTPTVQPTWFSTIPTVQPPQIPTMPTIQPPLVQIPKPMTNPTQESSSHQPFKREATSLE